MGVGDWVVVVALVAATLFGAHRALTDGRFRGTHRVRDAAPLPTTDGPATSSTTSSVTSSATPPATSPEARAATPGPPASGPPAPATPFETRLTSADLGTALGERATLLQFSSAFCAPCRATRRVLADVASVVPGVTHVEVDAESHLELVRRVGVQRTPTTLILAADGGEVSRAAGALRKPQVLHALSAAVQP